ncbi:MAG: hypothetical protein Q8S19_06120, partial [Bacillota bacterium]|nr:hypothetical protein [Bacillota bacterium]
ALCILLMLLTVVLAGCASDFKKLTGEVVVYAVCDSSRRSSYLLLGNDIAGQPLSKVKLGPHIPASITYIDPFIFIPTSQDIGGKYAPSEWVYYVNVYDGKQGRFQVGWHPLQVLRYQDYIVVLSDSAGGRIHLEFYDLSFNLVKKMITQGDIRYLQKDSLIIGDNLFLVASGTLFQINLADDLTPQPMRFPDQWAWVSIAEWDGKLVASDRRGLWIVNPDTLVIEQAYPFPFERQGHGLSLIVGNYLLVGDTYSKQAVHFNLRDATMKYLTFDRMPTHMSIVGEHIYVSHHDGITILDHAVNIVETRSINGRFLSNFVALGLN